MPRVGLRSCVAPVAALLYSNQVQAYLDPGTGSMLIQGLIAAIATGGYLARIYWQRIKVFFSRKPGACPGLHDEIDADGAKSGQADPGRQEKDPAAPRCAPRP